MDRLISDWAPDTVVTTNYAAAARLAAFRNDVHHVSCSIYPQYIDLAARAPRSFARAFVSEARNHIGSASIDRHGVGLVVWGADSSTVLLHDSLLLGGTEQETPAAVGYPYWDALPVTRDDDGAATRLLEDTGEFVLITLGSFIGMSSGRILEEALSAVRYLGVPAVVVNAPGSSTRIDFSDQTVALGYMPISRLAHRAAAFVHHGGLGTTFAAVRAGRPAVVVPQAFDQFFNATLISRAGVGVDASKTPIEEALCTVLESEIMRSTAAAFAERLVPPSTAAARAADLILGAPSSFVPPDANVAKDES